MKNKLFATLVALSISSLLTTALAVPAYPGWRTMEQPDGTTIELRLVGDEFYHYWINRDGQQVTKNEAGYWEVKAEQLTSNQVAKRRAESPRRKNAVAPRKAPALQPTKLLVILVNFKDKPMTSAHDNAFFNNMLNQTGFSPSGCVSEYFKASSEGHYIPQFDVFGPVTLDNNMAYYGANDDNGDDVRPAQMAVDACNKADAAGCNFANYDTDNDGVVDNVYIIYAGYGEASDIKGTMPNTIWPHSWDITSAGLSLTKDGKSIEHYACSAELSGNSGTQADGVGTFAHEFSHVIGMPDYYDTDYGKNYDNGVTPGYWSLMDGGSYNNDGQTPPLYSAYDKYFMGWATPRHPGTSAKSLILLPNGNDCYYSYQITSSNSLVSATNTSEQYYIEYRKKEGWDAYLPGEGMVVWKVKYNSTHWDDNDLNNTAGTLLYTIVPADGKTKDYGATDDPFPGTDNITTWNGSTSGRNLKNITKSGNKVYVDYINRQSSLNVETLGDNATITGASTVTYNNNLALTVTPASGYRLDPESFDVTMGGACLVYGTDYTYSGTTLTINNVKGDVDVVVTGIVDVQYTVTWSVDGATTPVVYNAGTALVLPSTPSDCAGDGGKKFVGWTAIAGYSSATDAPSDMFTEAGTKTVTGNITYYAVYATESSSAPIRKAGETTLVNFTGNTKSDLTSLSYVTQSGLGSDYAAGNAPYQVKLDNTGDYILLSLPSVPSSIEIGVKMIGGATASSIAIQQCATSSGTFTTVETMTISGSQNDVVNYTTTGSYTQKYIKLLFTKGSNVGLGKLIVKAGGGKTYSDYALVCSTTPKTDPTCSFASSSININCGQGGTNTFTTNSTGAITYTSDDPTIASVDEDGNVQGVAVGSTTITVNVATTTTYNACEESYTVNVAKGTGSISAQDLTVAVNKTRQISYSVVGDGDVSFASANTGICTVNTSGVVTGVAVGNTTITISGTGTTNYSKPADKVINVTVESKGTVTCSVDPSTYYGSLDSKSAQNLFDAIHNVTLVGYTDLGYDGAWNAYKSTDIYPTDSAGKAGKIWDMYGGCNFEPDGNKCGNYDDECDCYNREHSIPKSWFSPSSDKSKPGSDVFHLVPTDGKVNGMRSNYAFGEVNSASYTYNGSKLGTPNAISNSNTVVSSASVSCSKSRVFEPLDQYKGDFARGYMGAMLHWEGSFAFTSGDGAAIFNGTFTEAGHYGLTDYGVALLMKWHRQDPVSQKEIDRNNGIQATQGNRNPFIDYPELAEYLWGNKAGQTFSISDATATFCSDYDPTGGGSTSITLSVVASPNEGGTTTGSGVCEKNAEREISATPNAGYIFSKWDDDNTDNPRTITVTNAKTTYTAIFVSDTKYTATFYNNGDPYGDVQSLYEGQSITAPEGTPVACTGYEFKGWVECGSAAVCSEDVATAPTYASFPMAIGAANKIFRAVYSYEESSAPIRKAGTDTYTLVTDAATLKAGDQIVIAAKNANYAMSTTQNTNNRGQAAVTKNDNTLTFTSSVCVFTLQAGKTSNTWAFYDGAGYIYAASSSSNHLKTETTLSNNSSYAISISDNAASIVAQGTNTRNTIRYNSSSSCFSCYASGQGDVALYRIAGGGGNTKYTVSPACCDLKAATNLQVTGVTGTSVSLSWNQPSSLANITKLQIVDGSNNVLKDDIATSATSATVTGLTECTNYTLKVASYSATCTKYSESVNAQPFSGPKVVTFNYNGGSGALASDETACGKPSVTLPTPDLWEHHLFNGWYTAASGGDKVGDAGESYTPTSSIEIFAQWLSESTYTATFYNNGDIYNTQSNLYATDNITLPAGTPTACDGYTFKGWVECGSAAVCTEDVTTAPTYASFPMAMGTANKTFRAVYSYESSSAPIRKAGETTLVNFTGGTSSDLTALDYVSGYSLGDYAASNAPYRVKLDGTGDYILLSLPSVPSSIEIGVKMLGGASTSSFAIQQCATSSGTFTTVETMTISGSQNDIVNYTTTGTYTQKYIKLLFTKGSNVGLGKLVVKSGGGGGTTKYTVSPACCDLKPATALNVTNLAGTSFTLNWTKPSDVTGITKLQVVDGSNNVIVDNINVNATSASVTGLNECQNYTFKIASYSSTCTKYSESINVQPFSGEKVVSFNYGEGSGTPASASTACGQPSVTLPTPDARTHFIFDGWYTASTGGIRVGGAGESYKPEASITLFARWTPESKYTATFYNNGQVYGTPQSKYAGESITKPATDPTACTGYTFVGWSTSQQAEASTTKPTIVNFGVTQTMGTTNINYYAVYSLTEGSGGSSASVTFLEYYSDQGVECTTDEAIRENLVDTCYGISTFSGSKCYGGMNGVKFGTGSYAGSITMDLSSAITTNTITVIASQYGSDTGTLGITINGGTAFSTSKSPSAGTLTYTVAEDVTINSVTVATSTKRAYISSITIGTGGGSVTKYTTSPECCDLEPVTNLSVTGVTTNSVTIGWTLPADMTGINNFQVVDASNNPVSGLLSKSATSATISGLTECTSYTYKVASVGSTCSSYSSTVNAQPFGGAKTVHLDYQGHGTGTTSFTSDCDHSTCTLPTPEAAGYVFGGWYSEAACTHKVADGGATYTIANTTLFAKWSQLHNITIGTITGSGSLESNVSSAIAGATITVTATPNAGYSLTWVQANGVPVSMSGNTGIFTMPDMDVNLTAYYTAINYTITVTATNGTVTKPNPATITNAHIGQVITLTATPNSGYSFSQWQFTGSGTLGAQAASTSFTVGAGDATLNALFVLPNTVSFSVPSCVTAIDPIQYNPGSSITLPTPEAIDGYTFEGWALSAQVSETTTEPTTFTGTYSPTGSPTMYAIYSREVESSSFINKWWEWPADSTFSAGTYVITAYSTVEGENCYYSMSNTEMYSTHSPQGYVITVKESSGNKYIETPADNIKWNYSTTDHTLQGVTSNKYVYLFENSNSGLKLQTAKPSVQWTPYVYSTGYWHIKATWSQEREISFLTNGSNHNWKSYTVGNQGSGVHDLLIFRQYTKEIISTVTKYTSNPSCKPLPAATLSNGSVLVGQTLNLSTLYSTNSSGTIHYSITSGEGTYATLSGSTLTGVAKGSVTIQVCQDEDAEFKSVCKTATVNVRDELTAEEPELGCTSITAKWTGTATQLTLFAINQSAAVTKSFSNEDITMASSSLATDAWGLIGSKPATDKKGWRLYKPTLRNTIYSPLLSTYGTITSSTKVRVDMTVISPDEDKKFVVFVTTPSTPTASPTYDPKSITIDGIENQISKKFTARAGVEGYTYSVVLSNVAAGDRIGIRGEDASGEYYLYAVDISLVSIGDPLQTYPITTSPATITYAEMSPATMYAYAVRNGSGGEYSNAVSFTSLDCGLATLLLHPSTLTMETLVGQPISDTVVVESRNIESTGNPILSGLSAPFSIGTTKYTIDKSVAAIDGKIALIFNPSAEGLYKDTLYVQVGDSVRMVTIIGRACSSTFVESGASNASGISENSATANFMTTTGFLMVSENGRLNTDLLTNGNFEFGNTNGWGINANSTAQTPTITTTGKNSGTYGAYVEVANAPTNSALSFGGYNYGGLYAEQMTLSPGTYTMTAYITGASSTTKQEYNNGRFYFGIWNSKGVIGRSTVTNVNTSEKKWIQITGTFELTETTTGYPFVAHQNAKDGYWIDDITLICTNAGASDHFYEYPITNQSSYSMTGLKPSTSYSYYVTNQNGCASNTITFTTSNGSAPVVVEAEDVRITAQKGGSANGVFVVNTTTAYSTIYLTKGATSGSCDCERITLMTNTVSSLGGVVNFNFTPKNTDAEGDEGVCTIQMMTNGMSDPAMVNIYWSVQAGCDPLTPTIEVTDIGSDFLTVEHNLNLGDDESIQIAFYKGADSASIVANQGDEIFFSKYYEAYMHKKLWAIYNPTAKKRSLAGMQVWRSHTDYASWFQESEGANKIIDLSNLGRFEPGWIYPNEEIIVYTANQVGSCEAGKAPNMGDWAAFSSNDQSLSFSGDDALLLVRKQSDCTEERNNIPPDTTVTGESLSWRLFEDANGAGWWMLDMIGARKKNNTPDGSACRNWTDPANGESGDDKGWVNENGLKVDDTRPYLLSTNRCLLIRLATVKSGSQAVQENVGDMYTLANEWKGIHVPTKPDNKQDSISCENFAYVGNFDYEDYYSKWTKLDTTDYKKGEQQPDGGWLFYDFPMAPYFCHDLLIEVVKETDLGGTIVRDVKKSETYHVPIVVDYSTTTADEDLFVEPDENNILNAAICKDCDIVIRDGAKLQHVTGGYSEFHDVHVYPKGLLEVNNASAGATGTELKLHGLYMYAKKDTISYAIINNNASGSDAGIRADRITHVKRVDDAAWYHFCLPYDCKVASVYQLNGKSMGSYGAAAGVWVVKEYDGAGRQSSHDASKPGTSGKHWKEVPYDGTLKAGKGYTLGIYENDTIGGKVWEGQFRTICFPSTSETKYVENGTDSKTTTIYKWAEGYTNDVQQRYHLGWNFTGLPYITKFSGSDVFNSSNVISGDMSQGYTGSDIYVSIPSDNGSKTYQQVKVSEATLHPFTGYFVQAKSDGEDGSYTLTYEKVKRQLAPARAAEDQRIDVELNIKAAGIGLDNAGIIVDDEFTADYEIGADLVKWYAEDNIPQLFTIATDETMLAYNAMPTALATNIPLGIYAPKAADYTLTIKPSASRLDAAEAVLLLYQGKIVADLMQSDYIITADKAGQISGYSINIPRARKITTDVDKPDIGDPYVITLNGQLTIANLTSGARVYITDMLGRILYNDIVMEDALTLDIATQGVYNIVVSSAQGTSTIKTVIR